MRENWRQLLMIPTFGYLGLGFPDVDQLVLPLLHHRSIITHSIAIPALFLLLSNKAVRFGACGFVLGISVHLSADVLSSPVGFGMVWLPWPLKVPLGPLSPLWLAANAIVGLAWAKLILYRLDTRAPISIYVGVALLFGLTYSIIHEHALIPFASFVIIFALSFAVSAWVARQAWFARLPVPPALPSPRKLASAEPPTTPSNYIEPLTR
jgi:hypothetical protein